MRRAHADEGALQASFTRNLHLIATAEDHSGGRIVIWSQAVGMQSARMQSALESHRTRQTESKACEKVKANGPDAAAASQDQAAALGRIFDCALQCVGVFAIIASLVLAFLYHRNNVVMRALHVIKEEAEEHLSTITRRSTVYPTLTSH